VIARGVDTVRAARNEGRALGAFTVYNLELLRGVCDAAERSTAPLLVQTGAGTSGDAGLRALVVAAAEEAQAPVGVHLDHARDVAQVRECLESGYSSVMIDGSSLPFEENVELTREVVELARDYGAWVEGELAGIAGDEDRSSDAVATALTEPAAASRFVAETGVDALAVAVGNVHGLTAAPVRLELDRLREIRDRVRVPLVLHGASGLDEPQLRAAVSLGVAKVNVNTDLRRAFLRALRDALVGLEEPDDLLAVYGPAVQAASDHVVGVQRMLGAPA
jgi:fructose-bisphosphate aldolase class II/tagatose 1,6-diphosphate aldolase GatY/KbaY